MQHSRFRHISTTALSLALPLALLAGAAVSACDCDCCDCDDPIDGNWQWYRTRIEADYDREWYIPVTPRETPDLEGTGIKADDLVYPMPKGLRTVVFSTNGEVRSYNMEASGGDVPMTELTSNLLFYNNDTEYIVINSPENFAEATATTRGRNPGSYSGNPSVGTDRQTQPVRSEPDMLFRAALSEQAVDSTVAAAVSDPKELHIVPVTLTPAVYTYVVRFDFESGLEYAVAGAAALSGMSSGVNLSTGRTLEEPCTVMFDCEKTEKGMIGIVRSFGAPGYRDGDELYQPTGRYGITLQLVLTNGKHISFNTDISPQLATQPAGGVVAVGGIKVSEEEAKPEGGGSFDVDVDPWGEPTDYEIML